jgi:hypothetical protein
MPVRRLRSRVVNRCSAIPAGTADPMQVYVGIGRQLVADDSGELLDVEPAGGDVGGHQHPHRAVGEAHQHLLAFALLDVAVQAEHRVAALAQRGLDRLRIVARMAEHQRRRRLVRAEQVRERIDPLFGDDLEEGLLDRAGRRFGVDGNFDRIALQLARDAAHVGGEGGREEQRLPTGRHLRDDRAAGLLEILAEHAVSLVEHQHPEIVELERVLLQVLLHAPGHADDDVRIVLERRQLRALRDATAEHGELHVRQAASEPADFLGDLVGQLARRAQHQRLRLLQRRIDARQQSKAIGRGLAAAGARLSGDIAPFQHRRQALGLDRRHRHIAQAVECGQQGRRQRQIGERLRHRDLTIGRNTHPGRTVCGVSRRSVQPRCTASGTKAWQVGISEIVLTFTCAGRVATQCTVSATSSGVSGSVLS